MQKAAFVTGIDGQDGAYLARLLLEKDYRVFGFLRRSTRYAFDNLDYVGVTDRVDFIEGDLADEVSLINALRLCQPDEVYNLAAQSFVGISWDQPQVTSDINAMGVLRLLNAIKNFCPNAKFYQASTSEMFGNANRAGIQTENTPFHPRSPYAVSKLFGYWITVNYKESYRMFCVNGILFNHESPIRGKEFVTRKITDGVARIKCGLLDQIALGNLDSKRDWGFAGDYVEAMWLMLQQKEPDDYIISTGETHSVREFARIAFERARIKNWTKHVHLDPRYKRPAELFTLQGRSTKAARKLNWRPKVKFEELVRMMVDADLERVKTEVKKTGAPRRQS
ncbi:GDP-mannose 4,6-dehydratase [Candidatus Sumerlaeota bacterium]|nr:GDP-mannose 4,6-dehydratase [Candidatus Sumerlaeota bacterium]